MTDGNRLACPNCLKADRVGEYVTGWREIGAAYAAPNGKFRVERPGCTEDAEHLAFFCSGDGCDVEEELPFHRMVKLDRDGEPIPTAIPGQQTLA